MNQSAILTDWELVRCQIPTISVMTYYGDYANDHIQHDACCSWSQEMTRRPALSLFVSLS